jgi:hypothetical protein
MDFIGFQNNLPIEYVARNSVFRFSDTHKSRRPAVPDAPAAHDIIADKTAPFSQ